jgi:hypothetical protein
VDLVEREVVAEQLERLGDLTPEGAGREVLDLGRVGVDLPVGRVRVAPLRADRDVTAPEAAGPQPRGEEGLRAAIGARGVEVPDAARVGGVEDLVGVALERLDGAIGAQIGAVPEVQIAGSAERREPESDRRDRGPATAEGARRARYDVRLPRRSSSVG